MFTSILLCYDGTVEGRRALRQGADVAVAMKANAYLLAVCRNLLSTAVPEGVTPELVHCEQQTANQLLEEGVQWLKDRGVPAQGQLVYGNPMVHIPEVAKRIAADLIVIGHRYRSRAARWWSEDEDATLLHKVSCSILVAMDNPVA
jgi:nucleotide-binding universal stress UspA family protein